MPRLYTLLATVTALDRVETNAVWGRAQVPGEERERKIVAYPALVGSLAVGDTVRLNVTATAMALGTGGVDFVISPSPGSPSPASHPSAPSSAAEEGRRLSAGEMGETPHLVKLRYAPHQHAVSAAEMSEDWVEEERLDGTPVIAFGLHSQLAPLCGAIKARRPDARIAYVFTDSAALALGFSKLVPALKNAGLLDVTLTCGQAFGGDRECVSLPSALIAARFVENADVILVGPGPGNAGTGTHYGFSGIEQAWNLDIAAALGGRTVCCLRASSADERERHRGLSHHSRTVLALCSRRHVAVWPRGFGDAPEGLPAEVRIADGAPGLALLRERGVKVTSMGRTPEQDPLFFHAASAAGAVQ